MQSTHKSAQLREFHLALLQIVGMMNGAERDEILIREAGIRLDRALFPLLVTVGKFGPIGVVDIADRVGRDYTTVSRQMGRLDELGLVERRPGATDRRVREAHITPAGEAMNRAIDAARERLLNEGFAAWSEGEFDDLVRLMVKLAGTMRTIGARREGAQRAANRSL
ncbi:MarR family winged helix-turn-helix transcriptional regulator [Novosphingobium sp. 1949]|uniref:MarR family winged helix-turn-helix transcriptional regulator n=1 Tax=Novosphingobium organovorum TaxID=2930092 RepID=A0ABT0BB42_9SPHN|nr:MarR family winged helix-turn-helix transcriptional regulator [Novosphingobium organovorum]MCJ2182277.1 MarR family winged helix-turn-helix transcriptional regulator [Novosphingobium organovorum]